jgi:hypothetical protein
MLTITIESNDRNPEHPHYVAIDETQFESIKAKILPTLEETGFILAECWQQDLFTYTLLDADRMEMVDARLNYALILCPFKSD